MSSRNGAIGALLTSFALAMAVTVASAQSVPLPVPAPQPKSAGPAPARPPAVRPPAVQHQQTAPPAQSSGFPSIFPKPPNLFGQSSGAATAFDARQRALADRVSAYLSNVRQLHGN